MRTTDGLYPASLPQSLGSNLKNQTFQITRIGSTDEFWLLPLEDRTDDCYRIELIGGAKRAAGSQHCDSSDSAERRLQLKIHSTFLAGPAGLDPNTFSNWVLIEDAAAVELALALFEPVEADQGESWVSSYLFGMLCARLKDLLTCEVAANRRRFESWQISELSGLLSNSIEEEISLAVTAARCRLSVCQFSRVFKLTYGMPLHKYLVSERVKRAQERLADTEDPIAVIALDCGFADQSSFTRRFSTVAGVSPGLWRKQARQRRHYSRSAGISMVGLQAVGSQ
jgi:AraC-like DNA-binding protein